MTALHDVALIDISKLSLYILPYFYIYLYILYIVYWQFVECSNRCLSWLVPVTDVLTCWLIIIGSGL